MGVSPVTVTSNQPHTPPGGKGGQRAQAARRPARNAAADSWRIQLSSSLVTTNTSTRQRRASSHHIGAAGVGVGRFDGALQLWGIRVHTCVCVCVCREG